MADDHDPESLLITPENAHLYDADAIGRVDFGDTQKQIARLKQTKEGRERLNQVFAHRLKTRGD